MEGRTLVRLLRFVALGAGVLALVSLRRSGATSALAGAVGLGALGATPFARRRSGTFEAENAITINRPAEELYDAWLDTELMTRVLSTIERVEDLGEGHTRWHAKTPAGTMSWESRHTVESRPRRIAWETVEGSTVYQRGEVTFEPAPGNRGTEVRVRMLYRPPLGLLGVVTATLYGEEAGQATAVDLRRFKQLMETGQISTTEGQPAYRRDRSGSAGHLIKRIGEAAKVAVRGGAHPQFTEATP